MKRAKFLQIEAILNAELEQARKFHALANHSFQDTAREVPTHLPSPDGIAYVENSAENRKAAFDQYKRALARFNDFEIRGVVPPDLRIDDESLPEVFHLDS